MKMKTHKALSKRVTVTKNGKVVHRYCGQNHFNTRDPGKITRKKRRDTLLSSAHRKAIIELMPYGS